MQYTGVVFIEDCLVLLWCLRSLSRALICFFVELAEKFLSSFYSSFFHSGLHRRTQGGSRGSFEPPFHIPS